MYLYLVYPGTDPGFLPGKEANIGGLQHVPGQVELELHCGLGPGGSQAEVLLS